MSVADDLVLMLDVCVCVCEYYYNSRESFGDNYLNYFDVDCLKTKL